ncbi:sterol regulatory element-binding protein cleavage-activating protein-like isoform X2 [Gigantopelta aegis]|uniref:sterol regulatory element-binding protein cleavage-activating protein-like isoform X2 n=1 Tax=Gigantopelta aegis TaxID=1735272 RepID=UPI001B88824C|nr:sterol regulatory element-binding protein cleavage-activating protein-like isoform X2 [Gigantopelta aegis]
MKSLRDRIAQIYYTHGLFCSSHPIAIIVGVICIIGLICYPLTNLPLPGNVPLHFEVPVNEYKNDPVSTTTTKIKHVKEDDTKKPRWLVGESVGFVQQIVVKATVSPWKPEILIPTDAFRGPLGKVYEILEHIENFKYSDGDQEYAVSDLCLRVSETLSWHKVKHFLPEYSCLILSPANIWQKDPNKFSTDAEIIKTIYRKFGNTIETPPSVKDVLFGLPWKQTGVSRYFIRNRQRTISYAITIIIRQYNPKFISAMKKRLESLYPETSKNVNNSEVDFVVNVHYRDINYFVEYTPLLVTYFVLLMYIYFSVRKIEMVKSKIGLAVSAVSTVIASLFVSVSICAFFGLTPTLNGGEIFPYLVIIIGLENVVVLTKSVVSTPVHLDVKVRVAQGLSKEGWFITKNLVTELAILLVGFFTFVPAIQEFCLFAVVGLLSDFFLQMVFFTTVLSVDIRRMELLDLHKQSIHQVVDSEPSADSIEPLLRCPIMSRLPPPPPPSKLNRSRSAPRLDGQQVGHTGLSSPLFPRQQPADAFFQNLELPRRLKLFFFWAKTRIFQRMIMVCTVVWIGLILYKTGLVDKLTSPDNTGASSGPSTPGFGQMDKNSLNAVEEALGGDRMYEEALGPVEHTNVQQWQNLYFKHWPKLFAYYNISLWGRYITILPSIHLSIIIDPEAAVSIRHPSERNYYVLPSDIPHPAVDNRTSKDQTVPKVKDVTYHIPYYMDPEQLKQFYPRSRKELVITVCLGFLSVIVISYFMVVLYKCVCSRNYSKWRSSWSKRGRRRKGYIKHIKETVPLVLKGHNQTIDCVVTDGPLVISSCWGGQLRIWDSNTGECITSICRKSITPPQKRKPCLGRNIEDSEADLYEEYHGDINYMDVKSLHDEKVNKRKTFSDIKPDLTSTINTDFSSIEPRFVTSSGDQNSGKGQGYDFQGWFDGVYEEHWRNVASDAASHDRRLYSAGDSQRLDDVQSSEVQARNRSWSAGDAASDICEELYDVSAEIWCLACQDGLVVAGCKNGHIEFWEADTGILKGQYDSNGSSVMGLCIVGNRVVAGRLDGTLDFLELETFRNPVSLSVPAAAPTRQVKGHSRHYSHGSKISGELRLWDEVIHCNCVQSSQAHQQPINVIKTEGGRVVSASHDHTLKVFRLEDCLCLYTLHGHVSNVTALCLDKCPPYAAASGSADGSVRLWDLLTGTCVYDFKGHDGSIVTLTATLHYIISLGLDDKICIWERSRGQMLHSLEMEQCCSLSLLTNNLLVAGGQGMIYLWDLTKGELVRKVKIDDLDKAAFVNHLQLVGNMGVACVLGTDIKVVHFPTILEKAE